MSPTQLILLGSNIPTFIVISYAYYTRRNLGGVLQPFLWFLYVSGVVHFISMILWFQQANNIFLLHFYVPVSTVLIIHFYRKFLGDFISPKIFKWTAIVFVLFSIVNSVFFQEFFIFNSYALTVQSIIITILSLYTFIWLMNSEVKENSKKEFPNLSWINSGLFIYYSSNLIIFYFGELIVHSITEDWSRRTWILHAIFSSVMYFCFFMGIWKNQQRSI